MGRRLGFEEDGPVVGAPLPVRVPAGQVDGRAAGRPVGFLEEGLRAPLLPSPIGANDGLSVGTEDLHTYIHTYIHT